MRFRSLHFLSQHGLLPALLSTLVCVLMVKARMGWSQRSVYLWLLWNLYLAWLPYGMALAARFFHSRRLSRWWLMVPPTRLAAVRPSRQMAS